LLDQHNNHPYQHNIDRHDLRYEPLEFSNRLDFIMRGVEFTHDLLTLLIGISITCLHKILAQFINERCG
jgi:hypothetical protein